MEIKNRFLYVCIGFGVLLSIAILPYFSIRSYRDYKNINFTEISINNTYLNEQVDLARKITSDYGYISGSEYLVLIILFAVVFYKLKKILEQSDYLNI